ncbi:MAG: dihydroorotate dehydrogenase electron transfer subunit [Candidatus Zapsychrus exili]|nr:dihydroorotate dehydrogenase electron transfer subunit [Candidatus Zapsychrus exili]
MIKSQNTYKIISNKQVSEKFFHICIDAKSILKKIKPGQFVHVKIDDTLTPFLRRPFSIHRADSCLEILYEILGEGTKKLAKKKKGDSLDIIGPLGNNFSAPPEGTKNITIVTGGVGVAPFLALTDILKNKKYNITLLYGGRNSDYVFSLKSFLKNKCKVFISTDDGSVGVHGRVDKFFKNISFEDAFIYTCGPEPMIKEVQKFAVKNKIKGEASLEEVMACGIGACLGCATKTKDGFKLVCYDGPVFDLEKLDFNANGKCKCK